MTRGHRPRMTSRLNCPIAWPTWSRPSSPTAAGTVPRTLHSHPLPFALLLHPQFAQEASAKVTAMAKQQQLVTEQTRMGMVFAETDDELAYLIFVAPDYPERVAKQLVDKHARAVESMASDGTCLIDPSPTACSLYQRSC